MSFIYLCTGKVLEKIIYLENFSQLTNRLKRFLYRSAIKIFVLILKKLVEKKITTTFLYIFLETMRYFIYVMVYFQVVKQTI